MTSDAVRMKNPTREYQIFDSSISSKGGSPLILEWVQERD